MQGLAWVARHKKDDPDADGVTVWAHGKQNLGYNEIIRTLVGRPGVHAITGRGFSSVRVRGPLIMAWANPEDIGELMKFSASRVTALLVIGWTTPKQYPWAYFAGAEFIGNPDYWHTHDVHIHPVVERVMAGITRSVNHNNTIAAGTEKDWTVGPLLQLHDRGYVLDEDVLVGWAVAHGWCGSNPKELGEYVRKINRGTRPRVSRGSTRQGYVKSIEDDLREAGVEI
jgi:hypothetical protein